MLSADNKKGQKCYKLSLTYIETLILKKDNNTRYKEYHINNKNKIIYISTIKQFK